VTDARTCKVMGHCGVGRFATCTPPGRPPIPPEGLVIGSNTFPTGHLGGAGRVQIMSNRSTSTSATCSAMGSPFWTPAIRAA